MSDQPERRVEPIAPVSPAEHVQRVRGASLERVVAPAVHAAPQEPDVAASTDDAYAQYALDPTTHQVIVRIRDVATDRVLDELPSPEVQAITRGLKDYAAMLARRAAMQRPTSHD